MPPEPTPEPEHDPSRHESMLADLIAQLFRDAEALLLQEIALARAEIGENLGHIVGGAALLLAGIATAFSGTLALIAAFVLLLGTVMPFWAACATIGAAALIIGATLIFYGWRLVARATLVPRRALQTLHDTGEWVREELT